MKPLKTQFKPMLASPADLEKITFPVHASPKIDGMRCSILKGKPWTRSLKPIPNLHFNKEMKALNHDGLRLEGLDGELTIGEPTDHDVYRKTVSGLMSEDGYPKFTYWVFDLHDMPARFDARLAELTNVTADLGPTIRVLPHVILRDMVDLERYESEQINLGYEGVILRASNAPYKYGRSTTREGYMLKVKRFTDAEAVVIGIEEEMHNTNEAQTNELGRTKRSTAKAGLIPKGIMGKLVVRDLVTGVEFRIGTGFDAQTRAAFWRDQHTHIGQTIVKYKSFPVGVKDLPRHPVFLGIRDGRDM